MAFEIPSDLNPALAPLAWMIGRWVGRGRCTWPGQAEFEFGQQIDFSTNGGPWLHYLSQTYTLDDQGQPKEPLGMEDGFWRPQADGAVDVVMCHPEGWSEVWAGTITGARIELVTDVVARTNNADLPYTAGHRLYGNVESDLMYTFDRATTDEELQPYLWARLARA